MIFSHGSFRIGMASIQLNEMNEILSLFSYSLQSAMKWLFHLLFIGLDASAVFVSILIEIHKSSKSKQNPLRFATGIRFDLAVKKINTSWKWPNLDHVQVGFYIRLNLRNEI